MAAGEGWQFWIDRGGTFTDIVARSPDGQTRVKKLLSDTPGQYRDAAVAGIRQMLQVAASEPVPVAQIASIKMGTTVATNALLERKGERTLLVTTQGLGQALRIGYQQRPDIFARRIVLPQMLYEQVVEARERLKADGTVIQSLDETALARELAAAYAAGIRSCAIVFMHGYAYPQHERQAAAIARQVGFFRISISHEVTPQIKLVSRGDTTMVDAYLAPVLAHYLEQLLQELAQGDAVSQELLRQRLLFMQSNGGLVPAERFQGKDSILSGPAGGIVGAVETSLRADCDKVVTFDMGGTSTDVAHYHGEYERQFETQISGVRLCTPMMAIHTVAAGGGSRLFFHEGRYQVGPESAGAHPGPACYRRGGPLTVTDCNLLLGRIQPDFFPRVFGPQGNLPLDAATVKTRFQQLAADIAAYTGQQQAPEEVAAGFLAIVVEKMANAIKKISLQRGYDLSDYTLCCFGGAGGQHAVAIAAALGIKRVFIHPLAGVLSAYGMGLAQQRIMRERSLELPLTTANLHRLTQALEEAAAELGHEAGAEAEAGCICKLHVKYAGTDTSLVVDYVADLPQLQQRFEQAHRTLYGFVRPEAQLVVAMVTVELVQSQQLPAEPKPPAAPGCLQPLAYLPVYSGGAWRQTPVFRRRDLTVEQLVRAPALIIDETGTNLVEPGWQAWRSREDGLFLEAVASQQASWLVEPRAVGAPAHATDPVLLEIFNNLFRSIAEQMGVTLQQTASSVNIKERLDFSCAVFDGQGRLVANAPHIPVHLGSMSASVAGLIAAKGDSLASGQVYISNNPYQGGTHLPDVTAITPVFHDQGGDKPVFYVASRGHHADIGGITPGSMPPESQHIDEEGVLLDNVLLLADGCLQETQVRRLLARGSYPARNIERNLADLQAQIAANEKGVQELQKACQQFGLATVQAYMAHVQDNAEQAVKKALAGLQGGVWTQQLDNGTQIRLQVSIDHAQERTHIDFSGTSAQQENNFNAPAAVCQAAVLYVFRTLVADTIPLNDGCLRPLQLQLPAGSMLNPRYPAAVVAGNVETSQHIVDALYAALGLQAGSQGTMNNLTFGNAHYQYYETICGGSGAGRLLEDGCWQVFNGTDAVQTHMTNSRLTDPEVLEQRFPVVLERFTIRDGSGGQGQGRGGNGVERCLRFGEAMELGILSSHRRQGPAGLAGGTTGQPGQNILESAQGHSQPLPGCATLAVEPGDALVILTPGGGGYGWQPA